MEEEAKVEYIVDGIIDDENNKAILYGATSIKELRKRLVMYEEQKSRRAKSIVKPAKTQKNGKPSQSVDAMKKRRCFICGSEDYLSVKCPERGEGVRRSECSGFGHIAARCTARPKETCVVSRSEKGNYLLLRFRLSLAIPVNREDYSRCSMYDVNYTEILLNGSHVPDPSWPTKDCQQGWEFNYTTVPCASVASELGWVCQYDALPTIAQSIFFIGAIFGGLIFGWVADQYGRIPALLGANLMGFLAGVATAFAGSFWQFTLCRFFVGFYNIEK
ncbi:organic cation transporter-like protein [Bombus vosnesenskii]|uniref:Organic cation transporter-like protein n=1 Tax=Bombus vosnesenskii TaxID=207650 RepID=A0A6J3L9Z9_9HYME|nr:organic cation transporter-like protein [Bombus vosnesenskii]